jgi:tRNA dimethylallyltransferase
MERIPVLVVTGPTASGKSALAVKLAKKRGGEIISADSRQVYKGLDIGTGKITKREMQGVPHHLLDVCSPKKVFTAHDFVRLGRAAIADIHARGKLPIICGGTGFYIDALLGRVHLAEVGRDDALRKKLQTNSAAQLFALLKKLDPGRAATMDTPSERNNTVRLIRALEIARSKPGRSQQPHDTAYEIEWVSVDKPDNLLKKRIHDRLMARMKSGMVAEARNLHVKGLSWRRMEALGLEYRYLARHLQGQLSKEDMLAQLEHEIWQYAKRQRTWWRRAKK